MKDRFDRIQTDIAAVSSKQMEYAAKRQAIADFIQLLQKQEGMLTGFDEKLWNVAVEKVIVNEKQKIALCLKADVKYFNYYIIESSERNEEYVLYY